MHFTNGYCDGCNHYIGWHHDGRCSGSHACSTDENGNQCEVAA